jgi:hypothetical protein
MHSQTTIDAECRLGCVFYWHAECRYAECRYAECHGAKNDGIGLSVVIVIVTGPLV